MRRSVRLELERELADGVLVAARNASTYDQLERGISRAAADVLRKAQEEEAAVMLLLLLAIDDFDDAAVDVRNVRGFVSQQVGRSTYPTNRARKLAKDVVAYTRDIITRSRRTGGYTVEDPRTVPTEEPPRTPDKPAREPDAPPTPEEIEGAFPPERAEAIGTTEVTGAASAGAQTAREILADDLRRRGLQVLYHWYTSLDDRVCPVCRPLHNRPETDWLEDYPLGPPAHPNCRCEVRPKTVPIRKP